MPRKVKKQIHEDSRGEDQGDPFVSGTSRQDRYLLERLMWVSDPIFIELQFRGLDLTWDVSGSDNKDTSCNKASSVPGE